VDHVLHARESVHLGSHGAQLPSSAAPPTGGWGARRGVALPAGLQGWLGSVASVRPEVGLAVLVAVLGRLESAGHCCPRANNNGLWMGGF
jgi:hypothetical protein